MTAGTIDALATLGAAALFVLIFYGEAWWRLPRLGTRRSRQFVSFSAGMAVAYVFVRLLPELATATAELVEISGEDALPFVQIRVYCAALLGFMTFYGLEHMSTRSSVAHAEGEGESTGQRMLTGSYALYVFVVCYLMAHEMRAGGGQLVLYALAMGLHFLGFAYSLHRDDPTTYDDWGRKVLAVAALGGWAVALARPLPESFSHILLGFVGGALIMDTVTSELAEQSEGQFLPFVSGAAIYTVVLSLTEVSAG
jgi:hypothetical protein